MELASSERERKGDLSAPGNYSQVLCRRVQHLLGPSTDGRIVDGTHVAVVSKVSPASNGKRNDGTHAAGGRSAGEGQGTGGGGAGRAARRG